MATSMKRRHRTGWNHGKTGPANQTAVWDHEAKDPRGGGFLPPRPMSRFKRRRLEASGEYQAKVTQAEHDRRRLREAADVAADARQRLKDAAEGM